MNRKISYWKLRETELQVGARTLVMGVLNVTPDSFSDGGRYSEPDQAYARALELEEQGADIIDIGAESTRPGSQRISAEEEWRRLVTILKRLRGNLRVPLSVNTWKSEIAERALDHGVAIINDPSGLTFDPAVARIAANANAGLILTHMRGQPDTWAKLPPLPDPAGTITRELEATVNRARHAGVERNRIVIDPGIGFGKRGEQNAVIIAHLRRLEVLDYPVLVGVSRKSFLAQQTEIDTEFATAAAVTAAILNGAHIVRVHDVGRMMSVVRVADEIAAAVLEPHTAQTEERPRPPRRQQAEAERPGPPRPPVAAPPPPPPPPPAPVPPKREADREGFRPPKREPERADFRPPKREPERADFRPPKREPQRGGFRPPKREPERGGFRPPKREPDRGAFRPSKREPERGGFSPPKRRTSEPRTFEPRSPEPRGPKRPFEPRGGKGPPRPPKRPFRKRP